MTDTVSDVVTADELVALLDGAAPPFVLDVREPDEVAAWSIPGAVNVPLGELADHLDEVPADRLVVTVCAAGVRAMKAAELLRSKGRTVTMLRDGMGGWGRAYDEATASLGGATVTQVRRRGKGCLSYVVSAGGRAVVIDPSSATDRYQAVAARHEATISAVLDTHLHADHVSGARALAAATGARLLLNPGDPFAFPFDPLTDGLEIPLDDGVHLEVAATYAPGHTEGSTVYRLGTAALFTGDTLFLESVGRPDLADEAEPFAHALYRSLHRVVLPLADDVWVLPAHYGPGVAVRGGHLVAAPLGELRRSLPALALDEASFVQWAVERVTDRPDNYREIVRFNAGRSDRSLTEAMVWESGPNRCAIA